MGLPFRLTDGMTLSTIVLGSVGLALAATLIPVIWYQISSERRTLEQAAERQAIAALDMLEAVHINAMLFRDQKEDNDPAVDTLNGAMAQFSEQNANVELWLVMSEKLLAYQIENNQNEIEGPLDEIDERALAEARDQTVFDQDGDLRITRPVVMGKASAAHPKCASCHTVFMDIGDGEVIGAYSARVDLSSYLAAWRRFVENTVIGGVLVIFANLLLIYILLRRYMLKPVFALSDVADKIAKGADDVVFDGAQRGDALGVLARSLNTLQDKMHDQMRLKVEAARAQEAEQAALATDRAKSEFLATMSHEIRTPLNGVMGMAELLSKSELDEKQRMFTDTIVASGQSLLWIINDVLDYSKIEAGQLRIDRESFDIIECVETIATLFSARAASKNVELLFRVDPQMPRYLIGDRARLTQVLSNLVGNAVKFTEKGHIFIDAHGCVSGDDTDLYELEIDVSDTGIGLSNEDQRLVFDKFKQVDMSATRRHQGAGLGLAISAALTKLMDGRLAVESEVGEGSTFSVELRLPIGQSDQIEQASTGDFADKRILVVDDNAINRAIMEEQLAACGCLHESAINGGDAVAKMRAAADRGEGFDLVILDYQMPDLSGLDVLRLMKSDPKLSQIATIMLTSVGQDEEDRARSLGLDGHLIKPVRSELLLQQVGRALGRNNKSGDAALDIHGPLTKGAGNGLESGSGGRSGGLDILVCEDNEINLTVTVEMLERLRLSYITASNGLEGFRLFEKHRPRLVLMDISMPEMNGFESLALIREAEADAQFKTPVIALTAQALAGDREQCLDAGFNDHVAKPFSLSDLSNSLTPWLESERELDATTADI